MKILNINVARIRAHIEKQKQFEDRDIPLTPVESDILDLCDWYEAHQRFDAETCERMD